MHVRNLPAITPRYWTAILVASMCGANTGDFLSHNLHLGHWRGLAPLAAVFLLIILGRAAGADRDRGLLLARDHRAAHRGHQSRGSGHA